MTLWLVFYPLIVAPVCALIAGVLTWAVTRGSSPDSSDLLKLYSAAIAVLSLLCFGVTKLDAFRERFDPELRANNMLLTIPSFAAAQRYMPLDFRDLEAPVAQALAAGQPLSTVLANARARQLSLVRAKLGFARDSAVLSYARALLPALRELQGSEPKVCVRFVWHWPADPDFDIAGRVESSTAASFDAAVALVFEDNAFSSKYAPHSADKPLDLPPTPNELRAGNDVVLATMEPNYDYAYLEELRGPGVAKLEPVRACAASIEWISRVLALSPNLSAAMLRGRLGN